MKRAIHRPDRPATITARPTGNRSSKLAAQSVSVREAIEAMNRSIIAGQENGMTRLLVSVVDEEHWDDVRGAVKKAGFQINRSNFRSHVEIVL